MTPLRAILAAVLATVMLFAGALIVARTGGREAGDIVEILLAGPGGDLGCFLFAAGAFVLGGLGVLAAFLAFIAREEDDDGPFRRRGFPKSAPILLIALSLGLVWFALRCSPQPAPAQPIAIAVAPTAPTADDPVDEPEVEAPAAATTFAETAFDWTFKDPLIGDDGARWMSRERPFTDESAAALLCGKAWVAVTGSASEEGPADRNAERSRLRALAGAEAAQRWLARRQECGETPVIAIDLGQHEAGGRDESGAATAYQRRVLVMSRDRRIGETLTAEAARAEVLALLADQSSRAAFLGGRRFTAEPVILTP